MQVPFVDLNAQYVGIKDEVDGAMSSVIDSSGYILGPQVGAFEKTFAELVRADHVCAVSSGTEALHMAVRALGIGPGDEVITVVNTWISTAFCISYVGAKPVFVDIDPATYQMDPAALEAAITPKTKAVIPVHMFGHPAPMSDIMAICKPKGIKVIEDVAQAPLATTDGRMVGTFGDAACYSFYPSKNLGCYGDSGAVTSNDPEVATALRTFTHYGQSSPHHHTEIGHNARMDTLQAAVLLAKIGHLEKWTERRRDIARSYGEKLAHLPLILPQQSNNAGAVYHLYPVQVEDRDECLANLRSHGVMAQIHYPTPVHLQPCYQELGYGEGSFPVAENFMKRTLSLPIFPEITEQQLDHVAEVLSKYFQPTL